jgi:hypothetical protein
MLIGWLQASRVSYWPTAEREGQMENSGHPPPPHNRGELPSDLVGFLDSVQSLFKLRFRIRKSHCVCAAFDIRLYGFP